MPLQVDPTNEDSDPAIRALTAALSVLFIRRAGGYTPIVTTQAVLPSAARVGDPDRAGRLILVRGALQNGHFRLLGDLHTNVFVAFSRIAAERACLDLVARWLAPSIAGWSPDALFAPSTAGVGLASLIARVLEVPLFLAQLDETGRACGVIGTADFAGSQIALVNDVVTTGNGMQKLKGVAEDAGARIVGASWFVSRRPVAVHELLDIPTSHVLDLELPAWSADDCQLCSSDLPLEDALDLN